MKKVRTTLFDIEWLIEGEAEDFKVWMSMDGPEDPDNDWFVDMPARILDLRLAAPIGGHQEGFLSLRDFFRNKLITTDSEDGV